MSLLQMQSISKRFGGVQALRNVSLGVEQGEIVAVIGENGAGKSTLMKVLGGVHAPDAGQISVDGQPVTIGGVSDALRHGIAFIHQELNVLDNLDVAANVFLGREPLKGGPLRLIDRAQMRRDTRVHLDRLGLSFSPDTPLSSLSIAEQQMVEIAKALSTQSRVVIMDEPTSSLTMSETDRLLRVCRDLKADGVGIIYISHRLREIEAMADRVVALRDGQNAGELAREEINHDRMVSLMVGRDLAREVAPQPKEARPDFVRIEGLRTRRYPAHRVSFGIAPGEILGMAGLVGAGRSEVAEAIFGVTPALEGTVSLGGERLAVASSKSAIGHGIYLVPEDRRKTGLLLDWPIRDNISLPSLERYASPSPLSFINRKRETDFATREATALSVKAPSVETKAGNLSGGNQQKVVLAKWLGLEPKLLIFDEPTRGIDVGAKAEIYRLMRVLSERGVSILMISSDMEEVLSLSDRIAVMCEGQLTGILSREDAGEEAILRLAVATATEHTA